MIKIVLACILLTFSNFNASSVSVSKPYIYAQSYVIMDGYTRQVIDGKDIHLVRSVASISKIMTAILAIEKGDLAMQVVISDEINKVYGSMIYAEIGSKYTLEELIYGLMLRSGNDAAVMIAKTIGGSVEGFVEMMNEKANELRMKDTIFVNPHGLDEKDGGNLSSSYDMALLMAYASNNPKFTQISGSESYKSSNKGMWQNKNRLLSLYDNTIAGKTGYTRKAKRTLSTSAKDGDTHLVIVTLNCGGDFSFHKSNYEYYFAKFERRVLFKKGIYELEGYNLDIKKDITYQLEKSEWSNYRLLMNIVHHENKCLIYIVDNKNNRTLLDTVKVDEIVYKDNRNWFSDFIEWLKGVF